MNDRLKEIRERFLDDNLNAVRANLPKDPHHPDPDYYFSATYKLLTMMDEQQEVNDALDSAWERAKERWFVAEEKLEAERELSKNQRILMQAAIDEALVNLHIETKARDTAEEKLSDYQPYIAHKLGCDWYFDKNKNAIAACKCGLVEVQEKHRV